MILESDFCVDLDINMLFSVFMLRCVLSVKHMIRLEQVVLCCIEIYFY